MSVRQWVRISVVAAAVLGAVAVALPASAAPRPSGTLFDVTAGLCLGIQGSSHASGAKAVLGTCTGSDTQVWDTFRTTTVNGVFGYQFRNHVGLCLGVSGSSGSPGAQVVQGNCSPVTDHSQIWQPGHPEGDIFVGFTAEPGRGDFWLKNGHSNNCLDVQAPAGGATGGSPVIIAPCVREAFTRQVWST